MTPGILVVFTIADRISFIVFMRLIHSSIQNRKIVLAFPRDLGSYYFVESFFRIQRSSPRWYQTKRNTVLHREPPGYCTIRVSYHKPDLHGNHIVYYYEYPTTHSCILFSTNTETRYYLYCLLRTVLHPNFNLSYAPRHICFTLSVLFPSPTMVVKI